MKKLLTIAFVLLMASCENPFSPLTFKVIGNGTFTVAYSDSQVSKVWNTAATSFDMEMVTNEAWAVTAQNKNGNGVTVECYKGRTLIRKNSTIGYGIATISGTY